MMIEHNKESLNRNIDEGEELRSLLREATSLPSALNSLTSKSRPDFVSRPKSSKEDERRPLIVNFIKRHGQSSIKDISAVLPDVGLKTIQRELLAMIEEGLLTKEGERRWSRYSLTSGNKSL